MITFRSASIIIDIPSSVSAQSIHTGLSRQNRITADAIRGLFDIDVVAGKAWVVQYEPDTDLRDIERVPLLEEGGGIEAYLRREVLPDIPKIWVQGGATKIGRYFYEPQQLRTLAEIATEIVAAKSEAEDLLDSVLVIGAHP